MPLKSRASSARVERATTENTERAEVEDDNTGGSAAPEQNTSPPVDVPQTTHSAEAGDDPGPQTDAPNPPPPAEDKPKRRGRPKGSANSAPRKAAAKKAAPKGKADTSNVSRVEANKRMREITASVKDIERERKDAHKEVDAEYDDKLKEMKAEYVALTNALARTVFG